MKPLPGVAIPWLACYTLGMITNLVKALTGVLLGVVQSAWASPFQVGVAAGAGASGVVVSVAVPSNHFVYAGSFRVSSGGVDLPLDASVTAEEKADPSDASQKVKVYARSFESVWQLPQPVAAGVDVTVRLQGCNATTCFLPQTEVFRFDARAHRFRPAQAAPAPKDVENPASSHAGEWGAGFSLATAGGYLSPTELLAFLDKMEGRDVAPASAWGEFLDDPISFFHAHGIWMTLVLVLIGGVLLNFTPCVLPMIPVNLAIIGAGAGSRLQGLWRGGAYGAGMMAVYGGMGWLVQCGGLFVGALQASPWFSLGIAILFALLSLALFDVFAIDLTRFSAVAGGRRRHGLLSAFLAGGVAALLAGACVAPVVLAVLLLAGSLASSGERLAQFLPFVLGLGMALPWPFAGARLAVLPRPGAWMVRVKQGFGVFVAVMAMRYAFLAYEGFRPARMPPEGSIAAGDAEAWRARVEEARRLGKPLFVDFWATWCTSCRAMEQRTFADKRVNERLARYVVVRVQAERPDQSPAREMLAAFTVRGLPCVAVLRPARHDGTHPPPDRF